MSKLSAVTTGQPTQGMGTVPTATRTHASPLQAQRAEAEASGALGIDDLIPQAATAEVSPRDPRAGVRAATTAAWLALDAKELEVRKYFREVPVATGLELLAKMRKQCDLAAGTLQQRIDDGNTERCTGCGKTLEEVRKSQFLMTGSDVDPETGVPMPYRFCSAMCVRERNREKMLPKDAPRYRFDGQPEGDIR